MIMFMTMFKLVKTRLGLEVVGGILSIAFGVYLHSHFQPANTQVIKTAPTVQTVYVDKPVIDNGVVKQVITNPKDQAVIKGLLRQNKDLKDSVTSLTVTVAELQTKGGTADGGVITSPDLPPSPPGLEPLPSNPLFTFKDWQLTATYNDKMFSYTLDQKFVVYTVSGRDKEGKRVDNVQLFQLDKDENRVKVPVETVAVEADETVPHWMVSPRVQGGLAATFQGMGSEQTGGVVAFQWLKHGRTRAAEDTTVAVASPAAFLTTNVREVGLLPVSYNLGQIPHQPFTNLWVSPYVGLWSNGVGLTSQHRYGIVISSTF